MTNKEVMQMALDAIALILDCYNSQGKLFDHQTQVGYESIKALRAALARPKKKWKGLTNAELEHFEDTIQEGNFEHPAEIVYSIASILREKNT